MYLLGYRKGLHLNVPWGRNPRLPRLTGRTWRISRRCIWSTFYGIVTKNPVCYLRLMRRALSRLSRSLARISFLYSSSSTILSVTTDRLLAFRSKMIAPGCTSCVQWDAISKGAMISALYKGPKSPVLMILRSWIRLLKVRKETWEGPHFPEAGLKFSS